MKITDGTGGGYEAGVDSQNRLMTESVASTRIFNQSEAGLAYSYSTGFVSLSTTASYNAMLSLQGSAEMTHINTLRLCSTQTAQWYIYKNSSTGTLYTSGTADTAKNLNFGSGAEFEGTILKGADGLTVTNGELIGCVVTGSYSGVSLLLDDSILLTPGNTVSVLCKPSASGEFSVTCIMFEHESH